MFKFNLYVYQGVTVIYDFICMFSKFADVCLRLSHSPHMGTYGNYETDT